MTTSPPRSADHMLTTETIVQIIKHKYDVPDGSSFFATCSALARSYFDPERNFPPMAVAQLGYPSMREEPEEEEKEEEDKEEESDEEQEADFKDEEKKGGKSALVDSEAEEDGDDDDDSEEDN
jgi:hypothetical protein